jgi:exosortase/archaeosortase family protein
VVAVSFVVLTVVGGFLSITLLLAAGWTCLLWAWLRERTPATEHTRLRRILVFAFLAFPWVTLDLEAVGWWFRLSGAYVTAGLFKAIGFHVIHNGTELTIQGAPIAVTAACSGLKVLQSMLIAGSFLAHVLLGDTPRYWQNIAALAAIAWAANTARILLISVASLTFGQEFAMGLFHTWGGLSVLVLMFIACWGLFQWQAPSPSPA